MLAQTLCYALIGVDGIPVKVETDVSNGRFVFVIVGLPDTAVKESSERVLNAIRNSGYPFPGVNRLILPMPRKPHRPPRPSAPPSP